MANAYRLQSAETEVRRAATSPEAWISKRLR